MSARIRTRMDLLVSKTLLASLLVLAVRCGLVQAGAEVNRTCINQQRTEFNEKIKDTINRMDKVYIDKDARLFKDGFGDIEVDFGNTHYHLMANSTEIKSQHPVEKNKDIIVTSDSGDAEVKLRTESDGSLRMYLIIRNSTLNCTVILDTDDIHGDIILHPVFFTLSFSPDSKYLVYMAEGLADEEWNHYNYAPNLGGLHWQYKVIRPQLFLVDVNSQEVSPLPLMSPDYVPGRTIWTRDSQHVITVARRNTWSPCPECTDYLTRLLMVGIQPRTHEFLTSERAHVSEPRVVPGQDSIVYFSNQLTVKHNDVRVPNSINAPQSLYIMNLKPNLSKTELVCEVHDVIEDIGHIYPSRVHPWPHRMFLKVCSHA